VLVVAGGLDLVLAWLATAGFAAGQLAGIALLSAAVVITALLQSLVFPIAHHLGSSSDAGRVGSSVSKVYFANIVGSTFGPLVTGFVLLQWLSLQQSLLLFAVAALSLGLFCWSRSGALHIAWSAAALLTGAVVLLIPNALVPALIAATADADHAGPLRYLIENRYGIVHALGAADGDDIVFGGNAYDGRINIDLVTDSNGIARAYILGALHAAPARVLVIGLSGGAWAQVISGFRGVERMDIVEINPGYLELIRRYPTVAPLLDDARVTVHVDDGRRWLKRHPERQFDLIVMNTSNHWRAYTSLLLSQEFNRLVERHLSPDGIFAYNSTFFWDAFNTTLTVFPYVYSFSNLVIASRHDLQDELAHARERLAAIRVGGRVMVDPARPEVASKIDRMVAGVRRFDPTINPAGRALEVITDQNMINEYKYGRTVQGVLTR
jgi:predicted membrane-bound spermidine synthase